MPCTSGSRKIRIHPPLFGTDGYEHFINWRICVELSSPMQYILRIVSTLFLPTLNQTPDGHLLLVHVIYTIDGIVFHLQPSLSWKFTSGTPTSCRTQPPPPARCQDQFQGVTHPSKPLPRSTTARTRQPGLGTWSFLPFGSGRSIPMPSARISLDESSAMSTPPDWGNVNAQYEKQCDC